MRFLAALLIVSTASPALAYLLTGRGVVRRVASSADEAAIQSVVAEGTVTLRGASARAAASALGLPEDDELAAHANVAFRAPGRCRITLAPVSGGREVQATFGSGKVEGTLASAPAIHAFLSGACELLAVRSASADEASEQVSRALKAHAVDLSQVALRRLPGVVAYAVGRDRAQAWFDKSTFRPVRIVFGSGADTWDVRLLERGQPPVGDVFPRVIEVVRLGADAPELRLALDRAERDAPVAGL